MHIALNSGQNFVVIFLFCLLKNSSENVTIIIVSVRSLTASCLQAFVASAEASFSCMLLLYVKLSQISFPYYD